MHFDPTHHSQEINDQINISPHEDEPISGEVIKTKSQEILNQPQKVMPQVSNLTSKKITEQRNLWQSIVKFFQRHFSAISPNDYEQANEIDQLVAKIKSKLDESVNIRYKAKMVDKKFSDTYPSTASVSSSGNLVTTLRDNLTKIKQDLAVLEGKKDKAVQLAEEHAAFNSLPEKIKVLQKKVRHFESQLIIAEKFLNLEVALTDYHPEEKWEQFDEIVKQRKELQTALKEILAKMDLNDSPNLKKYVSKSQLSATEIHTIISNLYPDMKRRFERLVDATIKVINKRIANLDRQVNESVLLIDQYRKKTQQIERLESNIHDQTIVTRIYRLFHFSESLIQQLKKVNTDRTEIYQQIQKKGQFNTKEIGWLREKGKNNDNFSTLINAIEELRLEIKITEFKEDVSNQIEKLIHHLVGYEAAKNWEKQSHKPKAIEGVQDTKADILKGVKQLVSTFNSFDLMVKGRELPSNFQELDGLKQLEILTAFKLPSLGSRMERFIRLIPSQKDKVDISQVIKEAFTQALINEEGQKKGQDQDTPLVSSELIMALDEDVPSTTFSTLALPNSESSLAKGDENSTKSEVLVFSDDMNSEAANVFTIAPPPPPFKPSLSLSQMKEAGSAFSSKDDEIDNNQILSSSHGEQKKTDTDKEEFPDNSILGDIRNGKNLKKIHENPRPVPVKGLRTFEEIITGLEKGEIKISDITKEERKLLAPLQIIALEMHQRRLSMEPDYNASDSEEEEWS